MGRSLRGEYSKPSNIFAISYEAMSKEGTMATAIKTEFDPDPDPMLSEIPIHFQHKI